LSQTLLVIEFDNFLVIDTCKLSFMNLDAAI
jgi:hypothetical protein